MFDLLAVLLHMGGQLRVYLAHLTHIHGSCRHILLLLLHHSSLLLCLLLGLLLSLCDRSCFGGSRLLSRLDLLEFCLHLVIVAPDLIIGWLTIQGHFCVFKRDFYLRV